MDTKYSNVIVDSTAEEQEINFPMAYAYFSVTNIGDKVAYVSLRPNISERLASTTGMYEDVVIVPVGATAVLNSGQARVYLIGKMQIIGANDNHARIRITKGGGSGPTPPDPPGPSPVDTHGYILSGLTYYDVDPPEDMKYEEVS